jgi:hypothetical protein
MNVDALQPKKLDSTPRIVRDQHAISIPCQNGFRQKEDVHIIGNHQNRLAASIGFHTFRIGGPGLLLGAQLHAVYGILRSKLLISAIEDFVGGAVLEVSEGAAGADLTGVG